MGGAVLSVKYYSTEEGGNTNVSSTIIGKNFNDTVQNEGFYGISKLSTKKDQQSIEDEDTRVGSFPEQDDQGMRKINSGSKTQSIAENRKDLDNNKVCMPVDLSAQFNGTHICVTQLIESNVMKFGFYTCKRTIGNE
ncbi:Hypothetical protein NTJ_12815 [Nesidiocoris tenuis]|uniref:Uncharacterized protein n=1 Tax=Nesidiocoris tenuis TaxID=355587 RepID=A0ABN7B6H6_9HEMI|nr:Hypothetical protein NTJ_12815 [Nesidiocoris tenuis]